MSEGDTNISISDSKSDARNSRVSKLRHTNEEVIRKRLQEVAKAQCKDYYGMLAKCSQENGFYGPIACRGKVLELSACLDKYYTEDIVLQYLKDNNLPMPQPKKTLFQSLTGS